jgi:hypothetical protein
MSEQTNREQLDAVLEAYIVSVPEPNHRILAEWIQRYPEFAEELTELTVARLTAPFEVEPDEVDEATFQRDLQVVRAVLGHQPEQQTITSLLDAGKAVGLTSFAAIAQRTNLSKLLIRKLELHLLKAASLPTQLITDLSAALHVRVTTLQQYFQRRPSVPQGSFKSEQPPTVAEQEDFFEAVRKDLALTEEQRQYWLSLKP